MNTLKKLLPVLMSGLLVTSGLCDTLAAWRPAPETLPEGVKYASGGTVPGADEAVREILSATLARINQGENPNGGPVWPGFVDSPTFNPAAYTSIKVEVASDALVRFDSLTYYMNTYGFEREIIKPGTPEEEVVLSTLQLRLRSSLDNFQSDLASITSGPLDRGAASDLPFIFDLTGAPA